MYFLMEKNFGQPLTEFDGTCWLAARCTTVAFSTTCAVHIEDCGGWWLFGCHESVAEHWWLKPELSWIRLLAPVLCVPNREHFCKLQHASVEGMHLWVNKMLSAVYFNIWQHHVWTATSKTAGWKKKEEVTGEGLTYLPTLTITTLSSRYLFLLVLESGLHLMALQNRLVMHN